MKKLIAKRAVLYQGRQYESGEQLPAYDHAMVDAWLRADSASLIEDAQDADSTVDGGAGTDTKDDVQGDLGVVEGHLDPNDLEKMTKEDLEKLAKNMGIELPRGAVRSLIIEKLVAVPVQTNVEDEDAR